MRDTLTATRAALVARSAAHDAKLPNFTERCGPGKIPAGDTARWTSCRAAFDILQTEAAAIMVAAGSYTTGIALITAINTDPSVVDGRGPRDGDALTAQVPELARSPAADRISKGFQAVMNRDWPVALAWWQEALQRDPANSALKRSVELAQWMVDRRRAVTTGPPTPLSLGIRAASRGNHAEAIRQLEIAKRENPASAASLERMIATLRLKIEQAVISSHLNREQRKTVWSLYDHGILMLATGLGDLGRQNLRDAEFFAMGLPLDQTPWGGGRRPNPEPDR